MDFRSPLVCNYFAVDDVLIDDTLRLNFSIILLLRCPFIVCDVLSKAVRLTQETSSL